MSGTEPGDKQRFLSATTHTVSWFYKRSTDGELSLQPPFQRNPVWQEKQKAALIDTILKGYPIPELYIQTKVGADGEEEHIVVDGQQRIRACIEFISGDYPLAGDAEIAPGASFGDLTDSQRQQIFQYKFVVRELPPLTDIEIRDIFGRLNRNNVALNAQELRHATYWGEFISSMTEISKNEFWVTSGIFTVNDIRRMLDIEFVSEIAVARLYGLQNKKTNLDKYYSSFEAEFPDREQIERDFITVLGELSQILEWPIRSRWNKKTDFYTLFVVLARHREDMPFDREMRASVQEKLKMFSDDVGALLSDLDPPHGIDQARGYARGVRASSDLGSRRLRDTALNSYLFDLSYELPVELKERVTALPDDAGEIEDSDDTGA